MHSPKCVHLINPKPEHQKEFVMLLETITTSISPLLPTCIRLSAQIVFNSGEQRTLWFDLPSDMALNAQTRGDAWAILLLPAAIERGEKLQLNLPIDPVLYDNLTSVQRIWHQWYPKLNPTTIDAPLEFAPQADGDYGLFFSGGVDSYYSLLRNINLPRKPDILIMIWGFDLPLNRPDQFLIAQQNNARAAAQFGKSLLTIATNLKEEFPGFGNLWSRMSHGAGLAGIGQLLAGRLDQVAIGSTHDYTTLSPWGSHPLTDPLFSSSAFRVLHDGAGATRVEKTTLIASDDRAIKGLRVCWEAQAGSNCSSCSKCLRTMVTLDLINKRVISTSFDWSKYTMRQVARMFLKNRNDLDFSLEILAAAQDTDRKDIAHSINASIRRSMSLRKIDRLLTRLGRLPYSWQLQILIRKAIFGPPPALESKSLNTRRIQK